MASLLVPRDDELILDLLLQLRHVGDNADEL